MHSHLLAPDLRVSTLCLGVMPWGATVHGADAAALGDRFREAGGNFFDTAHCYSFWVDGVEAGSSERAFGAWLQDRGDRDDVIIATKGAHPAGPGYRDDVDYMTQARIAQDISDSLERLQTVAAEGKRRTAGLHEAAPGAPLLLLAKFLLLGLEHSYKISNF